MPHPKDDARWLAAAARLAMRGRPLSSPNPSVGALVVSDGRLVGRGWTQAGGRPHAEAKALQDAGSKARGATVFTSLEPCAHGSSRGPSCTDLIIAAEPHRVITGLVDPDPRTSGEGLRRIAEAGIEVQRIASSACEDSLAGYLMQSRHARPHVTLKLAMSLDGCIALANGESQWITGEAARAHVHSRRAMADAILVGGGTWRTDKPRLDVRLGGLEARSPQRWVLTRGSAPDGAQAIGSPQSISDMAGVQYLYVEGGAQTAAAFLSADLVDRLEIYRAPIIIGSGLPAIGGFGLTDLSSAHGRWAISERRQLGSDNFEAYQRTRNN